MSDGKRGPDQVILIGPPGAGKSTVGGLLARETGSNFVDTDQQIESKIGKKIAEIFIEDGEALLEEIVAKKLHPNTSLVRRSSLEDVFLRLTGRSLIE